MVASVAKEDDIVQINLRLPRDTLGELDKWVNTLNEGRRLGKATRNAVLLSLLERGLVEQPDLDAPPPKKARDERPRRGLVK